MHSSYDSTARDHKDIIIASYARFEKNLSIVDKYGWHVYRRYCNFNELMYIDVRTGWFENDRSRARIISYGRLWALFRIPSEETVLKRGGGGRGRKRKNEKIRSWKKRARVKCPRWLATISWQKDKNEERYGRILSSVRLLSFTHRGSGYSVAHALRMRAPVCAASRRGGTRGKSPG